MIVAGGSQAINAGYWFVKIQEVSILAACGADAESVFTCSICLLSFSFVQIWEANERLVMQEGLNCLSSLWI